MPIIPYEQLPGRSRDTQAAEALRADLQATSRKIATLHGQTVLQGDLGGNLPGATVRGIQGVPVDSLPPTPGQTIVYNGTEYIASTVIGATTITWREITLASPSGDKTARTIYEQYIVNTGTNTAFTFPSASIARYAPITITNDGSLPLVLTCDGTDVVYTAGVPGATATIAAGATASFLNWTDSLSQGRWETV